MMRAESWMAFGDMGFCVGDLDDVGFEVWAKLTVASSSVAMNASLVFSIGNSSVAEKDNSTTPRGDVAVRAFEKGGYSFARACSVRQSAYRSETMMWNTAWRRSSAASMRL